MHKFRKGDAVQYVGRTSTDLIGRSGIVIEQTREENVEVLFEGGVMPRGVLPSSLLLTKNADDPMPPVPNATMYLNRINTKTLRVSSGPRTIALVQPDTVMAITPETALDLAADLTRMALNIKRKQEKDDA